ncbi:EAL domain-containing protein [Ramlibacter sp. AW1]|uniref:EAL domain-containing protein n=1 Tax=Ramlibacter aurantiacus TaxID=2801330 RepID=A0A936ZJC3_9BURK|nr:GGDEF domain-containing phosphodiesterase [Ramlibacter aurantiacus]MBL0420902.1 EAL domain-containing protein [Ramlibacter aurantiacus]
MLSTPIAVSDLPPDPTRLQPESSFVQLLEQASAAGLWSLDAATGQVSWSERLAELLEAPQGYTPGAEQGFEFVAPDWREEVEFLVRRCIHTGEPFDREVQVLTYGQRRAWIRLLGHAVRDSRGQVVRVEGAVQELSPRAGPGGLLRHTAGWGLGGAGGEAFATVDREGRFTYLNEAAERLLGQPANRLLGRGLWGVFQKTVRLRVEERVREALEQHRLLELEELDAPQNDWLEVQGHPFGAGLALHLRNVTARRKSQEQLRLLEGSIARLNDIVIITEAGPFNEPGPRIVFVNEAFEVRTGYNRDEVLGRSPRFLQGPQTQRDRLDLIRSALEHWRPVRVDLINYRKEGEPFWVDLDISPVWDKSRKLTHWVAVGRDVTERKANEEKIQYLAFYDGLTRLPNRQLLLDRLNALLAHREAIGEGALMFIDLDNFKVLNDTLGHQKGDLLLQQVAERLRASVASTDTVARLGGDEFVVLLQPRRGAPGEAEAAASAVADRILAALGEPYVLPGYLHHSTCSIGVTVFGRSPSTVSELLKQADLAMYQAKRAGRNTVCFFDPQMQAVASANAALAADLRLAWRHQQFELDYQPQVDVNGRMTGAEALLRWQHPQRGRVPPDQFIPTAEETTLILTIGRWVLDRACEQLAAWSRRSDRSHLSISVNVSARQFRHPEFVDEVMDAIARSGVAPNKLKLELTESLLADGFDITVNKMGSLKRMGVALSLDDFGKGYSSLAYLKRLPLDQLKIDREFVKDVLTDANDAAIARTIIGLAQSLHLQVVAEGVETEEQREFLAQHGCDGFQGYLFCRPMSIERLEEFIEANLVQLSPLKLS